VAVVRIEGVFKHYAWGSREAIAELLGHTPSGQPEAELWFGVHSAGPARLLAPSAGEDGTLAALIASDLSRHLGATCNERFGRLPFLLKVLAAERPLSLQVHPSTSFAEVGFAREEALGIPRDSERRCYRDERHKPELLVALTPFEVLSGFHDPRECLRVLSLFGQGEPSSPLAAAFSRFWNAPDSTGLRAFFVELFCLGESERRRAVELAVRAAERVERSEAPAEDVETARRLRRIALAFHDDPGVLASLLLRYLRLEPFEGVFLPAREIHAYLSGTGLELMASSDNVLRAGLTEKHVDVGELLRVASFEPKAPDVPHVVRTREKRGIDVVTYVTPAPEFELILVTLDDADYVVDGPSLLLWLSGSAEATTLGLVENCGRGDAVFVSAEQPVRIRGTCRFAIATLRPGP
jgi:mannose-6-phosphate isomerase